MSKQSVADLEKQLAVKLPQTYIAALERLAKTHDPTNDEFMITDFGRLVAINLDCRANPKKYVRSPSDLAKSWPKNYFIIGHSSVLSFIDVLEKNPEVQFVRDRKLAQKDHLTPSFYKSTAAFAKNYEGFIQRRKKGAAQAEAAKRERQNAKSRKVHYVECPDLIAEGWRLAKSAVLVGPNGKKLVGIAGGEDLGQPPRNAVKHLLSIDCSALPENPKGLSGVISIYRVDKEVMYKAVHQPEVRLPRATRGIKLYATKVQCLPPFGILVKKGPAKVKEWFESQRVAGRDAEAWANTKEGGDHTKLNEYLAAFRANHPFFTQHQSDYHAMLGGWTIEYPSGSEWYEIMNKPLLISTLTGEPWLEVIGSGQTLRLFHRVT